MSGSEKVLVALVGHPNCGKTALFNALTGLRQKVANYPGVTVERVESDLRSDLGHPLRVLDLPGAYSLNPHCSCSGPSFTVHHSSRSILAASVLGAISSLGDCLLGFSSCVHFGGNSD